MGMPENTVCQLRHAKHTHFMSCSLVTSWKSFKQVVGWIAIYFCVFFSRIGTFFSPLLSAVNVLKLLFLFYIKRASQMLHSPNLTPYIHFALITVQNSCLISGKCGQQLQGIWATIPCCKNEPTVLSAAWCCIFGINYYNWIHCHVRKGGNVSIY